MGKSTETVELFVKHCNSPSLKASVRAFIRQYGVKANIENWKDQAIISAAFIKGVENSLRRDREVVNKVKDIII